MQRRTHALAFAGRLTYKPASMQFLRTLFWVVLAVFAAIIARNNWSDVTLNLWGSLQADIKLPLLVGLSLLLGFLPTFLLLRARVWSLKRKIQLLQHQPMSSPALPPAPTPVSSEEESAE